MAPEPHTLNHEDLTRRIDALVDSCRVQGLWFIRPGYYPKTDAERLSVLTQIQRTGSLAVFRDAGLLKTWLSRLSSGTSVGS